MASAEDGACHVAHGDGGGDMRHASWMRARRRDAAAVDALYRAHAARIRRYLLGMLGPRAPIDDLTHDAFIVAISTFEGFRGDASPSSWVHGIARNVARNWRRQVARREQLVRADPEHGAQSHGAALPSPERVVASQRSLERMHAHLRELPDVEHEAFVLHRLNDCTLAEVAAIQSVAVSTARARSQRAEAALKKMLGGTQP